MFNRLTLSLLCFAFLIKDCSVLEDERFIEPVKDFSYKDIELTQEEVKIAQLPVNEGEDKDNDIDQEPEYEDEYTHQEHFSESLQQFLNDHLESKRKLAKPDYAYSPYDLFNLVRAEESLYKTLKTYVTKVDQKLKILKSYLRDYDDSSGLVERTLGSKTRLEQRAQAIVSNPLTSYRLIRRFAKTLPNVWVTIADNLEQEARLWNQLTNTHLTYWPPTEQDWKESIHALFRIQLYNGIHAKGLGNGKLGELTSNVRLTVEQCMEIGLEAVALDQHDDALEWLRLAQTTHMSMEKDDTEIDSLYLNKVLASAIDQHNAAYDKYETKLEKDDPKPYLFTEKVLEPPHIDILEKYSVSVKELAKEFRDYEEYGYHTKFNFFNLCSGESLQTEAEKSRLHCWLEKSKHPYFYIRPMQLELLNEDPYLVQIYNVIGDKLIEEIRNKSISLLKRSSVVNFDDPTASTVSQVRTSSQTWIQSHECKNQGKYRNLLNLVEKITGLHVIKDGSSEQLQVACYGTSHHYDEHLDAIQDPRRTIELGERIATFMFYLSAVEQGGTTAFPVLGTAAKPIQGSGVFWYNLKKNGEPDKRTFHGGCPIVHGIKWGPTIMFERDGKRFFSCSAFRSRKLCPFYMTEEQWSVSKAEERKADHQRAQKRSPDGLSDVEEISNSKKMRTEKINHPLSFPNQRDKGEAQYHFNEKTVQYFMNHFRSLEFDSVLCVGTPSLHQHITSSNQKGLQSFLLDIDDRFVKLYQSRFALYNMCNHHFFHESSKYQKFLASARKLAIVVDPPFGVKVELIWHGCLSGVINDFKRANEAAVNNKTDSKLINVFCGYCVLQTVGLENGIKYQICN
ncbi:unnamed protein product [Orchesella dallaii]|uniref:procollagen-proline 4-dioxygenase n=1 Tax=Orchesella dallaii TaxID=48710 RepID=A0ABP1RZI9_9HEXA